MLRLTLLWCGAMMFVRTEFYPHTNLRNEVNSSQRLLPGLVWGLIQLTVFSMSPQLDKAYFDAIEARILGSIRDLNTQFVKSQGVQNDRLGGMEKRLGTIEQEVLEANTKLNAIMDALATRQEVRNLVRELRGQGMTLDETKIFVS